MGNARDAATAMVLSTKVVDHTLRALPLVNYGNTQLSPARLDL